MTQLQLQRESALVDDQKFHTVSPEDIKRLNDLFYRHQCAVSRVAVASVALGVGGAVLTGGAAFAGPAGGAAGDASAAAEASIKAGVTNAINMIKAIDGIGLAAFGVALAPMGFMVTLRVLNMVLSRV